MRSIWFGSVVIAIAGSLVACGDDGSSTTQTLITVGGNTLDLATQAAPAEPVAVSVVRSTQALIGRLEVIASANSNTDGSFTIEGVDVYNEMGLVLLTDDAPQSGTYSYDATAAMGGSYFPLFAGVASYMPSDTNPNPVKADLPNALGIVLPNAFVDSVLSPLWSVDHSEAEGDIRTSGFALGMVVELTSAGIVPIAGATVSAVKAGKSFDILYLPDFGELTADSTGEGGLFMTADPQLRDATITSLTADELSFVAEKAGYSCTNGKNLMPTTPKTAYLAVFVCERL